MSATGDFKRSPSKVWWNEDNTTWRLHASASPGSQDSGFSDTETFPAQKNILRDISKHAHDDLSKDKNSSSEYKEKSLPNKNISFRINAEKLSKALELQQLNDACNIKTQANSEGSPRKPLYQKRSRKSLFQPKTVQYAKDDNSTKHQQISSGVTFDGSNASLQENISSDHVFTQQRLNRSAPAVLEVLKENDERVEEASDQSDCDSEIENLFRGSVESPRHTSTPKAAKDDMRHCRRKAALNLRQLQLKYHNER